MTKRYDYLRAAFVCPNCLQLKDEAGLIVCWPCHRQQVAHNQGGYSERLEYNLDRLEAFIECEALAHHMRAQLARDDES